MLKIICLTLIFAVVAVFGAGLRIHPEALRDLRFSPPQYRKVDLKNGHSMVGALVEESPESLTLEIAGGKMGFKSSEIDKVSEISGEDIEAGMYAQWAVTVKKTPLFTMLPEDNLFLKLLSGGNKESKKPISRAPLKPVSRPVPVPPTSSGQVTAKPNTYMGIVQRAVSNEGAQQYARQMADEMDNIPRNPIVEAFKRGQDKKQDY